MLSKNIVHEIIDLCNIFAEGQNTGSITKETYTNSFKIPYLQPFIKKNRNSPNILIQNELKDFYNAEIKKTDNRLLIKNFSYWGNNIYSYVWTCIYFDFNKGSLPASYSPQLYILINKMGIKFGFCYGHQISPFDDIVTKAISKENLSMINEIIDKDISFFNSSAEDITARPEYLFKKEDQIIIRDQKGIAQNWTDKSLLIKEFASEEIPENISEVIQDTFISMKQFYLNLLPVDFNPKPKSKSIAIPFEHKIFHKSILEAGLVFQKTIIIRFVSSILTKPFVILSGLSGSGKTKLAQAFVQWICSNEDQYKIVPVGADWTNREPLLGYPNALDQKEYIKPDNGVVDLILNAQNNAHLPHFLILDEMNLSHVERYFADFLSVMESNGEISFHSGEEKSGVPATVKMPDNLFIIGTINVDETTYMFSPKVLDRANVIEFRISEEEIEQFLENPLKPELEKLNGEGVEMAESFMEMARTKEFKNPANGELNKTLITFFGELKKTGAEFGYRSAFEIHRLINQLTVIDSAMSDEAKLDIAIMQKLLPKLHGSRRKLCPILLTLGRFCVDKNIITDIEKTVFEPDEFDFKSEGVSYPLSLEKITRLHKGAVDNGFASYAEA